MAFAKVFAGQPGLPKAHLITVETDLGRGLHAFSIVGLPDKAVEEARDRVASAIKNSGFESPKSSNKKIIISLAPAELKKEGSAFDLPVALSFLLASNDITFNPSGKLFAGELALDGSVRPIRGALSLALLAQENKITELYLPAQNVHEASLVSGVTLYPVTSLREIIQHLNEQSPENIEAYEPDASSNIEQSFEIDFSDIRGQESAKRALEIAIAGGHNIALYGPPGTGKTMLARAGAALLPPLTESEAIEVTTIHSLAGNTAQGAIRSAPFRSPHHTASYASLIGGGVNPRPGEVTLAHRGVLFLDEFPEFRKDVINALREPLEDGQVSVSRAKSSHTFPARFMLIAALNPCPCGKAGTRDCTCMPHAIEKYKRKISGPIADRIDLWVHVSHMPLEELAIRSKRALPQSPAIAARIQTARTRQHNRFNKRNTTHLNAHLSARDIEEHAALSKEAEQLLLEAAKKLKLSPRGYHRTIKVARTIADLAGTTAIEMPHMLEALQYRSREM